MTQPEVAHVSLADAVSKGLPPPGNLAVPIFAHGSLEVEMYQPKDVDPQKPHNRDEVYLVARGTGIFFDGESRHPVQPGSFRFVGAGPIHRFEDFSTDFAVWVFFYGPIGGERAAQQAPPADQSPYCRRCASQAPSQRGGC